MTPKELLDNYDSFVRQLCINHLQEIQGGKLGPPASEDLSRCGALHAFLEAGGTIAKVVEDATTNSIKINELLGMLAQIPGGYVYSGVCSYQVCFPLKAGGELRISICDDTGFGIDLYDGSLPPGITGPAHGTGQDSK